MRAIRPFLLISHLKERRALWYSFPFTKTYGNLKKLGSAYARDVVCAAFID